MDSKTRLARAFDLEAPDRPPILGGWLAASNHIQALTGCSEDEYWDNPHYWTVEAERALGSDGMISFFVPVSRGEYRLVDEHVIQERAKYSMDGVLAEIAALPEPEQVRHEFDEDVEYDSFVSEFRAMQQKCGDMVWCPADWRLIPRALRVTRFGYENALTLPLVAPMAHRKYMRVTAEHGRHRAKLHARAIQDGIHPRAILTGEDLCGQQGPMISPEYLHKEYFPLVEYSLEPLVAVGAQLVWHCDGDVRPIIHDVLACGFAGLQGFQTECGVDPEWIVKLRTRRGRRLLIFGSMSVTTTLPFGTQEDVRSEVERMMVLCRDTASLVFLTSNTINPDVPLENVRAFWNAVLQSSW
jgi:hypothetical protein